MERDLLTHSGLAHSDFVRVGFETYCFGLWRVAGLLNEKNWMTRSDVIETSAIFVVMVADWMAGSTMHCC